MSRPPEMRLADVRAAIGRIRQHEATCDAAGLQRDSPVRLDAVVRQLAVVGEAVAHLPADLTDQEPSVPWRDVVGMRLWLDHGYWQVDPGIVWSTVDRDLRVLEEAVARLLRSD